MTKCAPELHHPPQPRPTFRGRVSLLIAAVLIGTVLAATTCRAAEWQVGVDQHPHKIGPNAWHFTIDLGLTPAGPLQFVGSQYDFTRPTRGVTIAYDFSGGSSGYADSRVFTTVGPTLFNTTYGVINGWDIADLNDGTFSGVVYATAPLKTVSLLVVADHFVPAVRGWR